MHSVVVPWYGSFFLGYLDIYIDCKGWDLRMYAFINLMMVME